MIRARLATPEEASPFLRAGYDTVGFILEDDWQKCNLEGQRDHYQEKIGHVWLSKAPNGSMFAHDLLVQSSDKNAATVLLHAVRTHLNNSGVAEVWMTDDENDPKVIAMWKRLGAVRGPTMYRLKL